MNENVTGETIAAASSLAGQALGAEASARVARAIGPALAVFATIEGTLPFEAEPSSFVAMQRVAAEPRR